jgi:hypothetical protein
MTEIRTYVPDSKRRQVWQIDLLMHPPLMSCFPRVLARPLCHIPALHFSLPLSHHLVKVIFAAIISHVRFLSEKDRNYFSFLFKGARGSVSRQTRCAE